MRVKGEEKAFPFGQQRSPRRLVETRKSLRQRLESRRKEIEEGAIARVYAVSDPSDVADPAYLLGLRESLTVALDYALDALECGEEAVPLPPPFLLAQARLAARHGVSLDTVLRRYFAGYSLLGEFLLAEVDELGSTELKLQPVLRGQAAIFDRLIAAVSEEHQREVAARSSSGSQRQAERVKRLLAGELIDVSDLNYDLGVVHVGIVARERLAGPAIRAVACARDMRLLLVEESDGQIWAWLGTSRSLAWDDVTTIVDALAKSSLGVGIGIGEPVAGIDGWRLTHRQAAIAASFTRSTMSPIARYGDVGLIAALAKDEVFSLWLQRRYLQPLEDDRDEGRTAMATLRAYFAAEQNVSSAAAALGVKRHTVTNRLRTVEERLGRPLSVCYLELDIALRLERNSPLVRPT